MKLNSESFPSGKKILLNWRMEKSSGWNRYWYYVSSLYFISMKWFWYLHYEFLKSHQTLRIIYYHQNFLALTDWSHDKSKTVNHYQSWLCFFFTSARLMKSKNWLLLLIARAIGFIMQSALISEHCIPHQGDCNVFVLNRMFLWTHFNLNWIVFFKQTE